MFIGGKSMKKRGKIQFLHGNLFQTSFILKNKFMD